MDFAVNFSGSKCCMMLRDFWGDRSGGVMVMAAASLPVVAAVAMFAVDHALVVQKSASLQRAADAAAIATAQELHFVRTSKGNTSDTLTAIATSYANNNMPGDTVVAQVLREGDRLVNVDLSLDVETAFSKLFGDTRTLIANAKAEIFGAQNICIISAEITVQYPGLDLHDQSQVKAGECGIYSNSPAPDSIRVSNGALMDADFICSAGGYAGAERNYSTDVTTDCPQIQDPLQNRAAPTVTACDPSLPGTIKDNESVNLFPGTYCGGLTIKDDANVWFAPGEYIFQDGPLIIKDNAMVSGENVGLFFDDKDSFFEFKDKADVSFSAPETGVMAGIVVSARKLCEDTSCQSPRQFTIKSVNVRSLLGTIYIPQDDLLVDTTVPVSEEAAFTILIVDNLILKQSAWLVLNTDYAATSVPVPDGFQGASSTRLVQ